MSNETKVILSIGLLSIAILGGIVFISSRSTPPITPSIKVDKAELVRPDSHFVGPKDAKVTLVEFSDFQCPACGIVEPDLQQINKEYKDKLKFVYRQFPLTSIHPNSEQAVRASEAASEQGKFWPMHDLLFKNQQEWSGLPNPESAFKGYAKELGLDIDQYQKDLTDKKVLDRIALEKGDTEALKLDSTPTFYLDGKKLEGGQDYKTLKTAIDAQLNK